MKNKSVGTKKSVNKKKNNVLKKKMNSSFLIIITFLTGILLIITSYAWLSASLNVKIKFFNLVVSTDNGLFISLDGVNFSDSIEISSDSVIKDLKSIYPNNTNQWAGFGLKPVSSNGIKTLNNDKFDVYLGEVSRFRLKKRNKKFLNTELISESEPDSSNFYIAFDIFLKNVSGSPNNDNLYLDDGTTIDFEEDTSKDIIDSMQNIMNSMRFGLVKIGSVSSKSDIKTIQGIKCNSKCKTIIYEPNSTSHSNDSIVKASEYGIVLEEGRYAPTYAVINEGEFLDHTNGQEGAGVPLDTEHFILQSTILDSDFDRPIFEIPNGITKLRAYVWIEGQDLDSLETNSKGAPIFIAINFEKDLAGYN